MPKIVTTRILAAFSAVAAFLIAGCGGGDSSCVGFTGFTESPNLAVELSRADNGTVVAQTRSDNRSWFGFSDLSEGTYIVRSFRTEPETPGQAPYRPGLYLASQSTVNLPDACGTGPVVLDDRQ